MIRTAYVLSVYKADATRPSPWDLLQRIDRHETADQVTEAITADLERLGAPGRPPKIVKGRAQIIHQVKVQGWTWTWDIQETTLNT